ncbi:2-polyprenyl-6-methoxyphenol hydroxylase-like oxidoreductase [Actinoalloteichus sp. GBA129-24]|uniref:2-polyprenyl-6-methoxyphenol hydroxylase-like oxidoreductase n=1 Tax=Actinoalloteichus fjordicus TaxID=1612552 RepID=A0AAC9PRS3_9PSEU|nr:MULTISPECIES: NAD(P)/FAD-dependent oxidoreductase [Actinoalloteichus]APU14272.1 2-polyprenyl-6-methoxyphenol hydroxylase-like oxidoreductase [Actinoalloteichus fjordicus]APU20242.1 2-polyprenyl-6-methoxyphenol hydroxylase-like oxidoreductase [Actinoalloteichus sp. GBA129-24]
MIIGCGVAGPVLAMFLQRAGIEAVVYEGRPEARDEVGAFLGIAPNGRDVLETLGIREEVEAVGIPSPRIAFLNHKAKVLGRNPQPVVTLKRGRLTKAVREAAEDRGIRVEWNKRLVDLTETDRDSVIARFADGTSAEADFLVGCDGINSEVRRRILPDAPLPAFTGTVGTGAYTRVPGLASTEGTMYMTFCLNGFFGYQVTDAGEVCWFENFHQKTEPGAAELAGISDESWQRRLLELHRNDHDPIPAIIAAKQETMVRYTVSEMPVLSTWHRGRVCLLGDAAHAMGPHSGQGGSMALEDCIVLAKCLRDIPDLSQAFATYQSIRKARVENVVKETRRNGDRKAPPGLLGRITRDLVLPFFLKNGVDLFTEIYQHHIEWDEKVLVNG